MSSAVSGNGLGRHWATTSSSDARSLQNGNGHRPVPTIGGQLVDPEKISAEVEQMGAQEAIAWAVETFGSRSLSPSRSRRRRRSSSTWRHRVNPDARFVFVDTELLFPETYETRDRLAERLRNRVRTATSRTTRQGSASAGTPASGDPADECCAPRKVATMRRALEGVECWVSGVRRAGFRDSRQAPGVSAGTSASIAGS